jgi:DNA-binding transcriptional MerR regulator
VLGVCGFFGADLMSTVAPSSYLTVRQVAELLHIHPRTVTVYVDAGYLPPPIKFSFKKRLFNPVLVHKALAKLAAREGAAS